MAQVATSNYPIPNDTGANVRSDINDNLEDLYSTSSGSSAPPAAIDNQLWIDTSTTPDTLKCKQGSSWISLGTISTDLGHAPTASPSFTGNLNLPPGSSGSLPLRVTGDTDTGLFFATNTVNVHTGGTTTHEFTSSFSTVKTRLRVPDGSNSAPSVTNSGDENTGLYFPSADEIGFTCGGTRRVGVSNSGLIVRDQNSVQFHDSDSSHSVAMRAPGTLGSNYTLTLPGDDGNNNQILKSDGSGNLSWTTVDTLASDAQFLKYQSTSSTGTITFSSDTWTDCLSLTYTPQSSSSKIIVRAFLNLFGKSPSDSAVTARGNGLMRILEGSTTLGENQYLTWGLSHSSTYQHYVTEKQWQFSYHAEYTNSNTSNKTFKVQLYEDNGVMELNGGPGSDEGLSWLTVMEVK